MADTHQCSILYIQHVWIWTSIPRINIITHCMLHSYNNTNINMKYTFQFCFFFLFSVGLCNWVNAVSVLKTQEKSNQPTWTGTCAHIPFHHSVIFTTLCFSYTKNKFIICFYLNNKQMSKLQQVTLICV